MPPLPATQRNIFTLSDQLMEQGPPIRSTVIASAVIALVGLGGFTVWAGTAPLASGAIASGMVRVDTNRKTVQHLEGGIVREILVREGERVKAGQVLARLEAVAVEADREVLQNQINTALADEARLAAERDGKQEIVLPAELWRRREEPALAALLANQEQLFRSERAALDANTAIHRRRIEQQRALIDALTKQKGFIEKQVELFAEELKTAEEMLAKGYERKPRVLGLQRSLAGAEGELTSVQGKIGTAAETVAESEAQIEALRGQRRNAIAAELEKARAKRAEGEETLRKTGDKLRRVEVNAPQDGVVLGLKFFASGAVVPPGGALLDIVPENENLVLQVRVNPLDIDVVREGLEAQVRLVAFKQRTTPTLTGRVTQVSADAIVDEKAQQSYYQVRIDVGPEELSRVPDVKLTPGMPVEAVILTGDRTLLDYLVRPLLDSFAHAFREQ
jgi:HlyD family type I secretion membrane fusion protein